MTAPSVVHQDGGTMYATDILRYQIHAREDITIGTWNVRTLKYIGKLKEPIYEMERYHWNILGPWDVCWEDFGEASTDEGHKIYFSRKEDRHEHCVGFLIHKYTMNSMMGY